MGWILLDLALLVGSGFGQEMKMVKVENLVWKGPGGVTFINPADDPRNKGGAQIRQSPDPFGSKRLPSALLAQPNQSVEPTDGRRNEKLKDELKAKLALTSGG